MRVAISGASGLIGSALAADLTAAGAEVRPLVRRPARTPQEIQWDPLAPGGSLDPAALAGLDAVVHLSGAPVAPSRWTARRKAVLRVSRIASTRAVVAAMTAADPAPGVLICGSAIGFYGDTGDRSVDETGPAGSGFLAELVQDWEAATWPAAEAGIRVVNIRSGVVLAMGGGMLGSLLLPFKLGLGARIGSGQQYLSWISLADEIAAIRFLLEHAELSGPVNLTAPQPVPNAEFTKALASAVRRPGRLRLPSPLVKGALGEVAVELLGSARVVPARLTAAGFTFADPAIGPALTSIVATG